MRSTTSRVELSLSQSGLTNRAHCRHRRSPLPSEPIRTVVDDGGALAITAWTCAACGDLIEEIRILSRKGATQPAPTRSGITAKVRRGQPAALSVSR